MSNKQVWENFISIGSDVDGPFELLPPVRPFFEERKGKLKAELIADIQEATERDSYPLPLTKDREGYYGNDHFNYWLSGRNEWLAIKNKLAAQWNARPQTFLEMGCASGRVIRHVALDDDMKKAYGCDINRRHVDWCAKFLPPQLTVFQNTSVPHLPLEDASIDLVTAHSVFSHIEAFETGWLMEIRRVLAPGGIAWITIHSDKTMRNLNSNWPVYEPVVKHPDYSKVCSNGEMNNDRAVFRWHTDRSYSSNVFYKEDYVRQCWGRIMPILDILHEQSNYQDVVVFRKEWLKKPI